MVPFQSDDEEQVHPPPHFTPCSGSTEVYPVPHPIPASHLLHVDDPTMELHVAGAQALQSPTPTTALYVPSVQFVQVDAPSTLLDVPTAHSVQTLSPNTLYVPVLQFVQLSKHDMYVPAGHDVAPATSGVDPSGQVQFVNSVLPTAETVSSGHAIQFTAPTRCEYVFAPHDSHVAHDSHVPVWEMFLYLPASHGAHSMSAMPAAPVVQENEKLVFT